MNTKANTQLREALIKAFDDFRTTFSAFGDERVNHVPFPGSWTPGQVASHIILATDGVPDQDTTPADRPFDALLPRIRPWWEDVNQKFKSPEPLTPDNNPGKKEELLNELDRVRAKDLAIIAEKDLTALCLDFELPRIGHLTRYEWLWFSEMHLRRHTFQLKNMQP